jgi:peptidoglycan/LPS O-acetylase OafA/YrhL
MTSHIVAHRRRVNATAVASIGERRHELDWLRVLVIVGLIPFHVLGLFAIAMTNYLTDGQPNQLAVLVSNFFILWPMSLLFLVAGASTWFALGRRTPRQYTRERILRLFVPFLFATLVLIPIQVFAVVRAYPQIVDLNLIPSAGLRGDESFLEFYPPYLAGYAYFLTHFSSMGETVFWGHIWFVPRLLLYALATLPLLLWLRSTPGMRLIARIADMFVVPGTTLLLGVAIALPRILAALGYRTAIQISGKANWDIYNQWAQLGVFMMCFLLGYIFYASPRLLHAIRRDGTVALMLGIVSFALLQTPLGHFASVTEATPGGVLISWLRAESEWLLVAGVLSVGLNFFTFANGLLAYLNDAAYPLYVLHMPVVIVVGLVVIQLHLPTVATLLLVVLGALGGTLGLYEYVIKRVNVLRLLFGLKSAGATGETSD